MDESSIRRHINAMMDAEFIAVDTESTGLLVKDGRDYGTGISVAYRFGPIGVISAYFPFRHPDGNLDSSVIRMLDTVLRIKPLVFHHEKHDRFTLLTFGIVPEGLTFDTVGLQHFLNEEIRSKTLDALAMRYGMERKLDMVKKWADAFGWATVPANLMAPYACRDAEITHALFERFWPKIKEENLDVLWPIERRFTRVLLDMEARGVRIDAEFCRRKSAQGRSIMAGIERDLGWKPSSTTQLGEFLLGELGFPVLAWTQLDKDGNKTAKSKPSFTKKVMEEYDEMLTLVDRHEAKLVLEYRGWQKAVSSLYESMLALVSPDGRIRPNFNQFGTKTGRLSCSEPNLQQIPRKSDNAWNGDAKQAFLASEGNELWGYDYAQLEFRLAASYGQVRWLLDTFNDDNADVFTAMAERIGVVRQTVKTFTYLTLYGGGLPRACAALGKPESEVKPAFDAFKESIDGIKRVSDIATAKARANGYVRYWTGRRRHFPFPDGHHKAFNSLLQGGGAEVVKRAQIAIDSDERIDKTRCAMVLQVHDEIVFDMDPTYRPVVEPLIIEHMSNFPEFGLKFKIEGKVWNQ